MPGSGRTEDGGTDAGRFAVWRDEFVAAMAEGGAIDVPCGSCTACCRSAMFIHVAPDERATLRRIPPRLLFPAPGAPAGHVVMGFDERGHCPMLGPTGCTIYDDRPRACRSFDCRVFSATGVIPEGDGKEPLAERAAAWAFRVDTTADADARDRVGAAVDAARHEGVEGIRLAIRGVVDSVRAERSSPG